MEIINDSHTYLSNSDIIKYAAIAICSIIAFQVLFSKIQNQLSLFVQIIVIGGILYILLKSKITQKKEEEKEFQNINEDLIDDDHNNMVSIRLKELLNEDKYIFDIYKSLLDLRTYNDVSYDTSLTRYLEFMKIKKLILHSNSANLKGLYETLDIKTDLCLNELLTVSKNVSDENSIRIQSAVRKIYKQIYGKHILEIKIYLKKKWDTEEITVNSFPMSFEDTKVRGNILTTKHFNEHYSVY